MMVRNMTGDSSSWDNQVNLVISKYALNIIKATKLANGNDCSVCEQIQLIHQMFIVTTGAKLMFKLITKQHKYPNQIL